MTKPIDRKAELKNITFLKSVLMLFVVLGHAFIFWRGGWFSAVTPAVAAPVLGILADYLGSFPIYGFVLASGYLYAYVRFERGGYTEFWNFVGNKALRLLVPYSFVLLVWVFPITQGFFHYSSKEALCKMVLGEAPGQLWFLPMLFFVFLLAWPLSDLFQKSPIAGLLIVLTSYGVGMVAGMFLPNFFQIWKAFQFLPFFWIGIQLRIKPCDWFRKIPPLVWLCIHLLLFVASLLLPSKGTLQKVLSLCTGFLLNLAGAVMSFSLFQWLGQAIHWEDSKFFKFASARSMGIYLFHQQLIYILLFLLNDRISPYLLSPILFVVSAAGAAGITSLLLLTPVTRFLIGEKTKKVADKSRN